MHPYGNLMNFSNGEDFECSNILVVSSFFLSYICYVVFHLFPSSFTLPLNVDERRRRRNLNQALNAFFSSRCKWTTAAASKPDGA